MKYIYIITTYDEEKQLLGNERAINIGYQS